MPQFAVFSSSDVASFSSGQGLLNFKPSNTRNLRSASARQKTGGGNARIGFVGDSTWAGVSAGTLPGERKKSIPAVVARELTASGSPAVAASVIANSGSFSNADMATYIPELSVGSGWLVQDGTNAQTVRPVVGGFAWLNNSTSNPFAWAIPVTCDTVEIYTLKNSGLGTYSWSINGGAATNVSTSVSPEGTLKTVISFTKGSANTLSIVRVSGGVTLTGLVAYDSTTPATNIINMGRGSSRTSDWTLAVRGWDPLNGIAAFSLDALVLGLGINDYSYVQYGVTTVDQYTSNLTTLINAWKGTSTDIILVTPIPSQDTRQDLTIQKSFRSAMINLAISMNLPCLDLETACGLYADVSPLGFMADAVHPNEKGSVDYGRAIARALRL